MRMIRTFGFYPLFFAALGAGAQNLQPGLWEFTTQMSGETGSTMNAAMENMQKQMAAMSPEQRKMMQDMMAKQGVQMGSAGGSGISVKMCLTQELLDRNEMVSGQRGECKNTWSPRTGNTMKYAFSCTNPPSSGEGEVTFISREAYSNRMSMSTSAKGKAEKVNINGSGKWLTKDCGAVKPLSLPTQ